MPRTTTLTPPAAPSAPPVLVIDPHAVYTLEQVRKCLHLRKSSLAREIRAFRMRVSKRCGRYYFLGEWLLEWLRGGELCRPSPRDREEAQARQEAAQQ